MNTLQLGWSIEITQICIRILNFDVGPKVGKI